MNLKLNAVATAILACLLSTSAFAANLASTALGSNASVENFGYLGRYDDKYVKQGLPYYHAGVDLRANFVKVYSIVNGKVLSAANDSFGTLAIESQYNGQKINVIYLHMSKASVKVGDPVTVGQEIGVTGNKGGVPPHLHIEVRTDGSKYGVALKTCSGQCNTVQKIANITLDPALVVGSGNVTSSTSNTSYDGGDPNQTNCSSNAKTVKSSSISGGKIELRWSNSCKTNWARVIPSNSSAKTSVTVRRESDGKTYSYSGTGQVYSPMVLGAGVKVCASGTISGVSGSGVCM